MNWTTFAGLTVTVAALLACKKEERAPQALAEQAPPPVAAPAVKVPTLEERALAAPGLKGAIAVVSPDYANNPEKQDASRYAAYVTALAVKARGWAELMALPETTSAAVMKDPESAHGKRMCASGSIIEIHKDGPVFKGGVYENGKVAVFVTTGDTGELVQESQAKFCGVVIGAVSYANSAGGVTHGVYLAGLFDLPRNKRLF